MSRKLIVLSGPDEGRVFDVNDAPLLIGRSRAADVKLIDSHISRVHCRIEPDGDGVALVDNDSASGTLVNGCPITRHELASGDLIRIGTTRLQYSQEFTETGAATPLAKPTDWARALVGQTISHYSLGAPIARGRTGFVFHATDTKRDEDAAVKVLHPDFAKDDAKVQQFTDAMKRVIPMKHPYLIRVRTAGKTSGHCWLAMEYFEGESLAAVIGRVSRPGKIDWKHVLRLGYCLAQALEYAHANGCLHQNLSPQNILVGRRMNEVKITDLMLAAAAEDHPTEPISAAGLPSETLPYLPPERTDHPNAGVDTRADLYSLGATLHAMFFGKPAHGGTTVDEVVQSIRLDAPPRLRDAGIDAPDGLDLLLRQLMAKRRRDRLPSATAVVEALERLAQRQGVALEDA